MSRITIDQALREKLNGLNEEIELRDEAGRTVGRFVPENLYRKMLYAIAQAQLPYSPEERERRLRETGGRTLAEIWKSLGRT